MARSIIAPSFLLLAQSPKFHPFLGPIPLLVARFLVPVSQLPFSETGAKNCATSNGIGPFWGIWATFGKLGSKTVPIAMGLPRWKRIWAGYGRRLGRANSRGNPWGGEAMGRRNHGEGPQPWGGPHDRGPFSGAGYGATAIGGNVAAGRNLSVPIPIPL